ncbi:MULTISPECIES: SDR family oxidoreductase [Pseudanabaena]|uniref:Short-chain dehydrogenase/reductase SDR n=2 Tax=Pseudanabaena TaxID=1152 RepID=L8N7P1_9CYAN|nr:MULTISPECIES: SDR family oxidoreductase [Pseudanabaena]ELS34695.1 short-chain dehydrogenase/reductase SDR [Pseudanabaena biceps PCC 7429]MDG3493132.1 SDR family oxidoreductase [Pseudanabaena catenata USMAC16]
MQNIFLAGSSRGVGREIAKLLLENEPPLVRLVALLRNPTYAVELEALGAKVMLGDALDNLTLEAAMSNCGEIDVVITTMGGLPSDRGERADCEGNKNLIDLAVKRGVKKFILVSSIGSGNSVVAIAPQVLQALGAILKEKEKAEQHLVNSGLTYTIIRPGGLKSEAATGNAVLTEDPTISGIIHRADVARLVCDCLNSDRANNKVFSAIDRHMLFKPVKFEIFDL